jgi:hypothetical protein
MTKHLQAKKNQVNEAVTVEDSSIQTLAYQIHLSHGGSELDNWLEAEQVLRNPTNVLVTSDRDGSGGGG